MSDNQDKITEFCSITGADSERAEFFLQASNWNTMVAVSAFYDNDGNMDSTNSSPEPSQRVEPIPSSSVRNQSPPGRSSQPRRGQSSRIQTFSSLNATANPEDSEEGQAFYAGGSEESGQQILGPRRAKKGNDDDHIAEEIFRSAKEQGAEVVTESERAAARSKAASSFVGTGYRLGESMTEPQQSVAGVKPAAQPTNVVLKFWKTGFTVNDGPLREYDSPQNQQFLSSIQKGQIPQELHSMGEIALDLENHRTEDYTPPKEPKYKAFTGHGQTLGNDTTSATTSAAAVVTSSSGRQVEVDDSQPTTNVQIRLADGSRLVAKLNHSHTIADVRQYIVTARPQYLGVAFSLATTLPHRQLTNDSVTLKQADLLNAVIVQKV